MCSTEMEIDYMNSEQCKDTPYLLCIVSTNALIIAMATTAVFNIANITILLQITTNPLA